MSTIGSNLTKLYTGAQPQTTLSNGIKIISVFQRLHGEIGRTENDIQKRDGQTKTQRFRHPMLNNLLEAGPKCTMHDVSDNFHLQLQQRTDVSCTVQRRSEFMFTLKLGHCTDFIQ